MDYIVIALWGLILLMLSTIAGLMLGFWLGPVGVLITMFLPLPLPAVVPASAVVRRGSLGDAEHR